MNNRRLVGYQQGPSKTVRRFFEISKKVIQFIHKDPSELAEIAQSLDDNMYDEIVSVMNSATDRIQNAIQSNPKLASALSEVYLAATERLFDDILRKENKSFAISSYVNKINESIAAFGAKRRNRVEISMNYGIATLSTVNFALASLVGYCVVLLKDLALGTLISGNWARLQLNALAKMGGPGWGHYLVQTATLGTQQATWVMTKTGRREVVTHPTIQTLLNVNPYKYAEAGIGKIPNPFASLFGKNAPAAVADMNKTAVQLYDAAPRDKAWGGAFVSGMSDLIKKYLTVQYDAPYAYGNAHNGDTMNPLIALILLFGAMWLLLILSRIGYTVYKGRMRNRNLNKALAQIHRRSESRLEALKSLKT